MHKMLFSIAHSYIDKSLLFERKKYIYIKDVSNAEMIFAVWSTIFRVEQL